jgi:chromosome segregation ATPase
MEAEILLNQRREEPEPEEEPGSLKTLEEKVNDLLKEFQRLRRERDSLIIALSAEKERSFRIEKRVEILSREREKIKSRVDQLLHRLKGIED